MANHKITIYHDGTILTMDADSPQVEALAVGHRSGDSAKHDSRAASASMRADRQQDPGR